VLDEEDLGGLIVSVMKEKGIDISGKRPTKIDWIKSSNADKIVWMAEFDAIPKYIKREIVDFWIVEDPAYLDYEGNCRVRDEIERKVVDLVREIEGDS
jgi:protein-tyrosine-phosphatase